MEVTLVGASWDVVAGDQTGVDFIPNGGFIDVVLIEMSQEAARGARTQRRETDPPGKSVALCGARQ